MKSCTFRPRIKRGPRTIASSSDLNNSNISQYSFYSENKTNSQQRNEILFEYSKIFNSQKQLNFKQSLDFKSEKEVKSCTFKPKLSKIIKVDDVPEANGVKKLINRLRNARKNKVRKSPDKPFCFALESNSSRLSVDLNSSSSSLGSRLDKSLHDRSFVSESDSISIRINLPNGKKSIFKIASGEDKNLAINKFVDKHALNPDAEQKFKNYLKNMIF